MAQVTANSLNTMPEDVRAVRVSVVERLKTFDLKGTLVADAREIAQVIEGREIELVDAFWSYYLPVVPDGVRPPEDAVASMKTHGVKNTRQKFGNLADQTWADGARDYIALTEASGVTVSALRAGLNAAYLKGIEVVFEKIGDDSARCARLLQAMFSVAAIEADIMSGFTAQYSEGKLSEGRVKSSKVFQERIAAEVSSASALGTHLRAQAGNASLVTRGMLGKASEVAAAAEQSAVAMRDAAHTAAGLIRAIEEARGEVEIAAEIATRASEQAGEAVQVSQTLSDTAKSIESILELIRDVAGQTNLLALNATIEAARAGDAGRGFAVVAQEVKSLANQTAKATDSIASKIAAIQAATRSTVETNGSIRETVSEVQASAHRIREAMELQAQTVTMITAAVDETALAADTMSTTIAAIRAETEEVATEIDSLETGFDSVNSKLATLRDAAGDYVKLVA